MASLTGTSRTHWLTRDVYLLLATRALRMLAYGALSVLFALHLEGLGFSAGRIGLVFTVALAGGAVTTTLVALVADRWGRRRWLLLSALAMTVAGAVLAATDQFTVVLLFAALGVLSPSGQEIGPFQSLEQASLAQVLPDPGRAQPYAWYNLLGSLAVAAGSLLAGIVPTVLEGAGWTPPAARSVILWGFAGAGALLAVLFVLLSPAAEAPPGRQDGASPGGLHASRRIVLRLTALFGVDALAGGLVVQSLVALWFSRRFGVGLDVLGPLFFGTNLLSALSYLAAARLAGRFGLLRTMVFTHLPSNVLLACVPLMPTWPAAAAVLLLRHLLSQMDVPTRQAYTMALVAPDERAAAAGLTNAVRPAAASLAPLLTGAALQAAAGGLSFFLAGALKVAYDLALWRTFRNVPLAHGHAAPSPVSNADPEGPAPGGNPGAGVRSTPSAAA